MAVIAALILPALLSMLVLYVGKPVFAGPPKDGSGYSWGSHVMIVVACVGASIVVSWLAAPFAWLGLRIAATLGWAGWGTAVVCALAVGLPAVHIVLNGDVTTEDTSILPHIIIAISLLGLSVWAAFWGSIALQRRRAVKSQKIDRK